MKNPGFFAVQLNHQFVNHLKITQLYTTVPSERFVVVAGDINNLGSFGNHPKYFLDYLHVGSRKIVFFELPDINDIAIQYQQFW